MKIVKILIIGVVFLVDWYLNFGFCSELGGVDVDDGFLFLGLLVGFYYLFVCVGGVVFGGIGGIVGDYEGCILWLLINLGVKVIDLGVKCFDLGVKSIDLGIKRTDLGVKSIDLGIESID